MATENNCTGLKVLDPVQGLVDYVNDIKPYHTKVVEVLVEYVYGEAVDITIADDIHTQIDLFRPETAELDYTCSRGYSLIPYGAPWGGWPIIPPQQTLTDAEYDMYPAFDASAGTITVPGDRSHEVKPGQKVYIVLQIEDYSDPQNIITTTDTSGNFNKQFTVTQALYHGGEIPGWTAFPDPSSYILRKAPHTIISLQESFSALPALLPDQIYVGMVRLAPVEIERVYSYSNYRAHYDPVAPDYIQVPDEGYLFRDITGVVLSTLDGFGVPIPDTGKVIVDGNLTSSNVFDGDQLVINQSTGNNGLYIIASLVYDEIEDETTIGVVEQIQSDIVDGEIRIDIPSNMFVVDGDYRPRFQQGVMFNITGGSFQGQYTTLYSDYINGKTRIRTTHDIIDTGSGYDIIDITTGFVLRNNLTTTFETGDTLNVVGSPTNDGSYEIVASTYDAIENTTLVETVETVDSGIGGQLFPVQMGVLKEHTFGYGETTDICSQTPHTMVRVKFHEHLNFSGLGLELHDDLIVHNMENNDSWGYELPMATSIQTTEPMIAEQNNPPTVPELNDFWFNTSLPGTSDYKIALHRFSGVDWKPITTAYWLDSDTKLLYYRTKTTVVDTDWVLYLAEPPGFNDVQPAIGETEIIGMETFVVENDTIGVPQSTFMFDALMYPVADIVDGTISGREDHFVVSGNVNADANGIDFDIGARTLEITSGGVNDGVYTISHVVYMSDGDYTMIFVEEGIPSIVVAGDMTIGPLIVPAGDDTLIRVTVNGVPAQITLDTPSQFTIHSPDYKRDDAIVAKVYDRTRQETNANVATFDKTPHQVFHDNVDLLLYDVSLDYKFIVDPVTISEDYSTIVDAVGTRHDYSTLHERLGYVLYGGNYVHRMIPGNRLDVYDFSTGGGLIEAQQPAIFPIVDINVTNNSLIIEENLSYFFAANCILSVRTSEGNLEDFTIQYSSDMTPGFTTIYVAEDIIGNLSTVVDYHFNNEGFDVYEIDNVSDSIVIDKNFVDSFPVGHPIKVFNSTTDDSDIIWTVASATYDVPNGRTVITVNEDIPDQDPPGTLATVHPAKFQTYSTILGAVYDPVVDSTNPNDQVKTYILPTTLANPAVDGITYTWYGPLRIELAMAFQNEFGTAFVDGLGASNELLEIPDRYGILETDATANTIRIHYDDPVSGLPVNLTDGFTPGAIFKIAGSQGSLEHETNNYQYVVLDAVWEESTTGDVVIQVDSNFNNLPPYVELDVISATNIGGPNSNETQLVVNTNMSGVVKSYNLDTGNAVIRFDQPIINLTHPLQNAATITRVEYTGSTTTFTLDTDIEDESFVGALGFSLETFADRLYYDDALVSVPGSWKDGYILREAVRIDQMPETVTQATIEEDLNFGWGTTQRWAIKSTDVLTSSITIATDVTGILDGDDNAIIIGSQGNDGEYEITSYSYSIGTDETTVILHNPDLPVDPRDDLEGYFQLEDIDITGWYQFLIKEADSSTDTFTVYGNATLDIQAGMQFRVYSTSNDGLYAASIPPVYDSDSNTTAIQVVSSIATITTDENGGWIESYRDYGIRLIFEDHIGLDIIENTDAALVLTSGSMIDAFDYNSFDIGAFDEDVATVLHLYGNTF